MIRNGIFTAPIRACSEVCTLNDIAEPDIALPVPALQLHLLQRMVVGRAGVDAHARQQRRTLEVLHIVGLPNDSFPAKVYIALLEQFLQHGSNRIAIGVQEFLRVSVA